MRVLLGIRWQTALVAALFLGSVATLLFTSAAAFLIPQQEAQVRGRLQGHARRLAEAAAETVPPGQPLSPDLHRRLAELTASVLAEAPGVEGGFFLGEGVNQWAGFGFPADPKAPPKGHPKSRRDPPPKEKPYIRAQVQESALRDPGQSPLVQGIDMGPGRVVVATASVGRNRPARLVAWVMTRLTGVEQRRDDVRRYQLSVGLALGGILLALVLTANLGRTLRRERGQRDRLREELRRAEHLATLGRLLAGVAHEVRNPLAGIRSTVQLWQRLPEVARNPESLDAVLRAVDHLNELVNRLLYFVRSGHDQHRLIDLNAVVREVLELVRAQAADQGVLLEADLAPDLPVLLGSGPALQQVVLNLAANALQAMPQGGRLCCRTRFLAAENRLELCVTDTGPGVQPADRPHLFEPFYTARPGGTGLGLALCREIVQQHGGQIQLLDAGPGAVFQVLLPPGAAGEGTSS